VCVVEADCGAVGAGERGSARGILGLGCVVEGCGLVRVGDVG
jgi:hypothetical protein